MARLVDKDGKFFLELLLLPNHDIKDDHWINYEITIRPNEKGKKLLFRFSENDVRRLPSIHLSGEYLYFEACYEPEIPRFCHEIKEVLNEKKTSFFFTPIDQGEFQFKIQRTGEGKFLVGVHSCYFLPKEYDSWPGYFLIGVTMDSEKHDILDFTKELEKEYEEIIKDYPEDLTCYRRSVISYQ